MKNIELKLATIEDYDCYFHIRSEKQNLYWTGHQKAPDYEQFKLWYELRLKEENKDIYLLWKNNTCLGSLNIDTYADHQFIGYSVKSNTQGQGLASWMVSQVDIIQKVPEKVQEIRAWINSKNIGSIRVCEKNGFSKSDITETRLRFGKEELFYLMIKPLK